MAAKRSGYLTTFEWLGFIPDGETTSGESFGECLFCGKAGKLYVNDSTGQFNCKVCDISGNVITFLESWYGMQLAQNEENPPDWDSLSEDRGMPVEALQEAGLVFDGSEWWIPVRNAQGRIVNLPKWSPGKNLMATRGMDLELYGIEELSDSKKKTWPVFQVEGHWDKLAMELILTRAGKRGIVTAVPGAGTLKEEWIEAYTGRDLICAYDPDTGGYRGKLKAYKKLTGTAKILRFVNWPDSVPSGFDMRDFWRFDGEYDSLMGMVGAYAGDEAEEEEEIEGLTDAWPLLNRGERPSLLETFETYEEHLEMSNEMRDALRVIYAVIIAQQIEGDPLWVHICAAPGGSKTELLMSCATVGNVITRSTITVNSLVSGWNEKKRDPSLIPQLYGRTFILKDWTEVLDMPVSQRHECYSIFRGAYDGRVEKSFGNGVERIYSGQFNMITGVTPAIYRESGASLGERFLIFHLNQGKEPDYEDIVKAAFESAGSEVSMRAEISEAARSFLEYRIERADWPKVPAKYAGKLVNLAQLVAILRANVERDFRGDEVLYRPQAEVGTRLVKQLKKLIVSLGLQNNPPSIGDEEYRITARVALNSCIGWNLDTIRELALVDGMSMAEIMAATRIPQSTLQKRLKDLCLMGVLRMERFARPGTRGEKPAVFWLEDTIKRFWVGADMASLMRSLKMQKTSFQSEKTAKRGLKGKLAAAQMRENAALKALNGHNPAKLANGQKSGGSVRIPWKRA